MDTQQCLKTLYEAYIQQGHLDEHQAAIPPKCYMYPIACWGNKGVGTQSNALHRNLLVMVKSLLQIHVSTRWVGMNHSRCLRIHTQAVTQIGLQDR